MKLVFLGPPGAGKGTQAVLVCQALGVPHISTGDMFRRAMREGTPTGLQAKAYIDQGQLVPDEVTIALVRERLAMEDCQKGFLLDGFPRTVEQAEALERFAALDAVVNLSVPDEHLIDRLTGRRVCPDCNGTYHINSLADPKLCPNCKGTLVHRPDDQRETIEKRLAVYHAQTSPLIEYYTTRGLIKTVNGELAHSAVTAQIFNALGIQA